MGPSLSPQRSDSCYERAAGHLNLHRGSAGGRGMTSPPVTSSNGRSPGRSCESKRKKKRKDRVRPQAQWKSEAQQSAYSSKLMRAVALSRLRSGAAVREAADRALASADKGRSRWSRAILKNGRIRAKFRKQQNKIGGRVAAAAAVGGRSQRKARLSVTRLKGRASPAVQRKVRVLGGLVPGCRKEPLPVILEEASDYIAALEMQVRAMTALAQLLSGGGGSSQPQSH